MVQQATTTLSREMELVQTLNIFGKRYTFLANSKNRVEEENVKMAADLELKRCALINLTLETEGLREELQTYKELPSILKQRQLDKNQMKEELHKLKADYQKATDSLVYHTKLKKDLNKDFFQLHKEKEKLLHDMELLRIQHHESLQRAQSTRQTTESVMLQEKEQQVILITKKKDECKAAMERLK